jgi:hypothetical protein
MRMFESISCSELVAVTGGKLDPPESTPPPPPGQPRLDPPGNRPEPHQQPPTRDPWLPITPDPLPG